ncbi:DUF6268 family outer membrane beta-barrel protein [Salegentibacter chungangensis]|uniref:DUF6268 family outer membrane beta-barrel protein n=1 Tax=Salegentibacter chungangensis TaxID=1335724 RepID=A0ABW3NQ68_9FLAO
MKKTHKFLFAILVLLVSLPSLAQPTDLARVEYTYFPQRGSDNSFRRFRTFVNFPIELNDKGAYLVPGLEYRNVNFKYEDPENFDTFDLDRFQSFTATLAYTFKFSKNWRFGADGGVKVASNFSSGELKKDDLIYTGGIYFVNRDEEAEIPWRLIFGLKYSTTTGFPFPLPILNYYRRFDPKWSYTVGIPKVNMKHYFNNKHSMQAFVTLDGFFANIQEKFDVAPRNPANTEFAESISMTVLLTGLGYEYNFTEHLSFYAYAGYTLINDIRLRDDNLDDLYTINKDNSFYTRGGLKFSIL